MLKLFLYDVRALRLGFSRRVNFFIYTTYVCHLQATAKRTLFFAFVYFETYMFGG
jgi:hypothetical protein